MRKFSMKKPGTPAIEDSSPNGSNGVSVDGEGAWWCARGPAAEPSPALPSPVPAAPPFERACAGVPGELPCGRSTLTCGAPAASEEPGRAGAGTVVVPAAGAGELVEPAGASAGGAEVVVSAAG